MMEKTIDTSSVSEKEGTEVNSGSNNPLPYIGDISVTGDTGKETSGIGSEGTERKTASAEAAKVDIVDDGSFDFSQGNGTVVSKISVPKVKIAMKDNTLILKREKPSEKTPAGMSATVAVVIRSKGKRDKISGRYVIKDEKDELTVTPNESKGNENFDQGEELADIDLDLKGKNGETIKYKVTLAEFGVTITPEDALAHDMAETRPDLVMGLALVELQKKHDMTIINLKAVFFEL